MYIYKNGYNVMFLNTTTVENQGVPNVKLDRKLKVLL